MDLRQIPIFKNLSDEDLKTLTQKEAPIFGAFSYLHLHIERLSTFVSFV